MKSGVAAMTIALENWLARNPNHAGTVALLLTSDEEGPTNLDGVRRVAEEFRARKQRIDYCVVGEPSSAERLGDIVRVGRRGSLSGRLTVRGVQGHVAYPEKVRNPIHLAAPALAELAATRWDDGNAEFPPTSFQISNINAGTGALNVVPGSLDRRRSTSAFVRRVRRKVCANAPRRFCANTDSISRLRGTCRVSRFSRAQESFAQPSRAPSRTFAASRRQRTQAAERPTRALSRRWVRKSSKWGRSMRRFTRSTSTSRLTNSRCCRTSTSAFSIGCSQTDFYFGFSIKLYFAAPGRNGVALPCAQSSSPAP